MSLHNRRAEHPTVNLELQQLEHYHDNAEEALSETISAYGKLDGKVDTTRWKSIRARNGVRLFRARQLIRDGQTPLLCVGTLRGRFDDILEGLYCDSTEEMLLMNAVNCPRLTDSAVLYAVQKNTMLDAYAFTGINQQSGKRMAYHTMQSVDLPECPQKVKHKRVHVSLSYVFEELRDDLVGVYMQGEMNYATLSYFAVQAMSEVLLAVANSLECARAKKLAHMMLASRPGSSSRKSCYVCHAKPSVFECFVRYASCNKHACKRCRYKERVLALDMASGSHLQRAEFCSVCISKMDHSSLAQIRLEGHGCTASGPGNAVSNTSLCSLQDQTNVPGSDRSLTSFVRSITAQVQEQVSSNNDARASSLSFMGQLSMSDDGSVEVLEEDSEGDDVLNSSHLKAAHFMDNASRRSLCSTTSSCSSLLSHDDEDTEHYLASLMTKLQQVSQQAE
ncbi:hypothetical protein PF005_g3472 [Phytophthora fragariae]|uniref:FYVE-type domain-containing protein n=1 Tax=Phytophthora fragariae TaxID=53985 RepID=A0A6A4A762_9STRA|nr:hypothetical protein PF003_g4026 [Phytophthora fragariae]KAE8946549.1 hypothetical protein PF009_g3819 [Phytophthora fragariae]KAE9025812.1 hypothetical protein PF011_g2864 [Phytophthora fragariae]KAE9133303.1 hypothetical protein PF007_g3406 [Phytophthora fragariae]KAE9151569.1 hypothetical protein PF006_g4146 [Phytophthora fragariae]